MSAAGSFRAARENLRAARAKLDAIDHVLGLMDALSVSLQNHGEAPELVYDDETGVASLHVRVGRVPPRVSVTVGQEEGWRPDVVPKPTLGDLSDRMQGLDSSGAAEIAEVAPSEVPLEALRMQPPEAEGARPAAGGSPAPYKSGDWTAEEEQQLLSMHDQGELLPDIADALGRRGQGVAAKLRALLARRSIPKSRRADPPASEAPPPPRPAVAPPAAGPVLQPRPRHEREAEARYAQVQDPDWPPARDLELVERMMRGDGAGGTAEAMGLEKPQIIARWRALFHEAAQLEEQAAMLVVLRARVHSQGE